MFFHKVFKKDYQTGYGFQSALDFSSSIMVFIFNMTNSCFDQNNREHLDQDVGGRQRKIKAAKKDPDNDFWDSISLLPQ